MKNEYYDLRNFLYELRESSIIKTGRVNIPELLISSNVMKLIGRLSEETDINSEIKSLMHESLNVTGNSEFLQCLDQDSLSRWVEIALIMVQKSDYSLYDLFTSRVNDHPGRALFRDMSSALPEEWSYRQVSRIVEEMAAVFHSIHEQAGRPGVEPRVAILCDNSVASACCDLACLMYDIPDTPLNTHFDPEILTGIFDSMGINIVVTDTEQRWQRLEEMRGSTKEPYLIITTNPLIAGDDKQTFFLGEYCKKLNKAEIDRILLKRKRRNIRQVATVMYTSGSTGKPKGVAFSLYNVVSKRFARAAAVPKVGINETFLCFLPLFHTFGRYLELIGSIYWHGTYVFTGNPSTDTLMALFPKTEPSVFISVPLRWQQLYDRCMELFEGADSSDYYQLFRQVTGNNLKWGLSAAGYLDPKVFLMFHNYGVELCSGFGMTEATGGITMTPPGRYIEKTTGIPLPGVATRFRETGEMEISGHYIARYFDEFAIDDELPYPANNETDYWLSTGDVFKVLPSGYYEIVDRVKDIYKNNKGQTIAPRVVEMKFSGIAGFRNTFLVGDGKPYNVLFIVPDFNDELLMTSPEHIQREYFHQIINAANAGLAPYERVINFTLLDRDFRIELGELTPKGSFNRKAITENFSAVIAELYQSNYITFYISGLKIQVPRWFFRDLGILEDDIIGRDDCLYDRRRKLKLTVLKGESGDSYQIGDLVYFLDDKAFDLGKFSQQPLLWAGNPEMVVFCPCIEGWDTNTGKVSTQVQRPSKLKPAYTTGPFNTLKKIRDAGLVTLNSQLCTILFGGGDIALATLLDIEPVLKESQGRITELIRRRLEALARHSNETIRCQAYRILLVDEPSPDYSKPFPSFLESGLSFLNEQSIREIARNKMEKMRLELLRKRLFNYRVQLQWPCSEVMRNQFSSVFTMLVNFVRYNPEYYEPVRIELTNWLLMDQDPQLAEIARSRFDELSELYESILNSSSPAYTPEQWLEKIVFDDDLNSFEINRIKEALIGTTFLKQSIMLAFDEPDFELSDVPPGGIWISRITITRRNMSYRLSITTFQKKHFDLRMVVREDYKSQRNLDTVFWLIAIEGYPFGPKVAPKLGCCRPELSARSVVYHGELTLWEKLREIESYQSSGSKYFKLNLLRRLFISAMATFFKGWENSGRKIIPGFIDPNNVIVPELDFIEGAIIVSIAGWIKYENTFSIIKPMIHNFYSKTQANYPWARYQLDLSWIFDAASEAFGNDKAFGFFVQLKTDLEKEPLYGIDSESLLDILLSYMEENRDNYYMPLPLSNAIDRYDEWNENNPHADADAKEDMVLELYRLYDIARYGEIGRYELFRHTYFHWAEAEIQNAFDTLLAAMNRNRQRAPLQFIELSDLQAVVGSPEDRKVFSRMVFPQQHVQKRFELVHEVEAEEVALHSFITDRHGSRYTMREPSGAGEVGQLFRLFLIENFPKTISDTDRHFVVLDQADRVIGGLCYRIIDEDTVHLDGIIISAQLKGRGIGSMMIDDFVNRMSTYNFKIIKAHFYLKDFYQKRGFTVDNKWGSLVKYLNE